MGLAAGFDKGAEALSAWPSLGFSWIEYGGVTRFPQEGNPKPRMFRSNKHGALVNRMGFNNPGATEVRDRLIERRASGKWPKTPVAANIGRSKKTPNESAASDYSQTYWSKSLQMQAMRKFYPQHILHSDRELMD